MLARYNIRRNLLTLSFADVHCRAVLGSATEDPVEILGRPSAILTESNPVAGILAPMYSCSGMGPILQQQAILVSSLLRPLVLLEQPVAEHSGQMESIA